MSNNNNNKPPTRMPTPPGTEQAKIMSSGAPKNLRQGVSQGVGNILGAAVGAAGVAVLVPTAGAAMGAQKGGVLGGILGFTGGAVAGALGAAGLAVGGVVAGVVQVGRGVAAVPAQIVAPSQGKWWNDVEDRWVLTDMGQEKEALKTVPDNDSDILGGIQSDLDAGDGKTDESLSTEVKDTILYDALGVAPDADPSTIKRRYYILARKLHPDKNPGNPEAAEQFKVVSEAYHILSDPEMRKKYNKLGRDGLKNDPNELNTALDPKVLFAFLFGSDKFHDYIGNLASATSASIGDSNVVTQLDARKLQKRRVARLAIKLVERITPWVEEIEGGTPPAPDGPIAAAWKQQAEELCQTSFGYPLVKAIGEAYFLLATQYQGSMETGQGFPSISKWYSGQKAAMEQRKAELKNKRNQFSVGLKMVELQMKLKEALEKSETEEERAKIAKEAEEAAQEMMVKALWTTTVVDITSTLYEVCNMVFFDASVEKSVRKSRAKAVSELGTIWMNVPEPDKADEKDFKQLYEDAISIAIETLRRKEGSQRFDVDK